MSRFCQKQLANYQRDFKDGTEVLISQFLNFHHTHIQREREREKEKERERKEEREREREREKERKRRFKEFHYFILGILDC
jgi:hypothetical protein